MSPKSLNLLFDLDGTLVNPGEGILASLRYAFSRLGLEAPPGPRLEDAIGPPLQVALGNLLGTDDQQLIWRGVAAYREHFAEVGITGNVVYDGMSDALELLSSAGASLYLATSKPIIFASKIIRHHGLSGFFRNAYGSELDGTRSDKGELIAHVLSSERIAPATGVMIGDRRHDVIGASKNLVRPVGVLWGYGSREELAEAGAEWLAERPAQLGALLER